VLFHEIADPACARVRSEIVARGLKPRIDFQNVREFEARLRELGGSRVPALWDGTRLHEGEPAVLEVIATMAPSA
jgi:hypothetical protein